jgi:ribonuclease P protein component
VTSAAGPQRLARAERLRGSGFQALFRGPAQREERPSFVALWRPCDGPSKVGFAVGRRVGGAVERNRARRRLREAYRRERRQLTSGFEVVFVGRPAVLTRSFAEILGEMRRTIDGLARAVRAPARVVPADREGP